MRKIRWTDLHWSVLPSLFAAAWLALAAATLVTVDQLGETAAPPAAQAAAPDCEPPPQVAQWR